jgi:hypothetical protein
MREILIIECAEVNSMYGFCRNLASVARHAPLTKPCSVRQLTSSRDVHEVAVVYSSGSDLSLHTAGVLLLSQSRLRSDLNKKSVNAEADQGLLPTWLFFSKGMTRTYRSTWLDQTELW